MTEQEFNEQEAELLKGVPEPFRNFISRYAYLEAHGCCANDVLIMVEDLVEGISKALKEYEEQGVERP